MLSPYVVITPARNEAQFIELTIQSMLKQTVLPLKWVIVSDGSTDGTDEIVKKYTGEHPWIELVRMPERQERSFAGKVHAFNAGLSRVRDMPYAAISSMDADITFDEGYFAFLLGQLAGDSGLGLVGTPFRDVLTGSYDYRFVSIEHVSGACQLFRRECFDEIGGYTPIKGGGIDHIAVISARMKGWKTRTFAEKVCIHHRHMGTAQHGVWKARFNNGIKDYVLGGHPLWELCRTAYQLTRQPVITGGLALLSGYAWALLKGAERPIPREMVAFRRREEMGRLRKFAGRLFSVAPPASGINVRSCRVGVNPRERGESADPMDHRVARRRPVDR